MAELSVKTDASELCAVVRMRDDARLADQMESWKERPLLLSFLTAHPTRATWAP
jgi:hypothetical protein